MPNLKNFIQNSNDLENVKRHANNYNQILENQIYRDIFNICIENIDLFPNINAGIPNSIVYIEKWLNKLQNAMSDSLPSQKEANVSRTLPDPVVNIFLTSRYPNLTFEQINGISEAHNLCMNIENIQGSLLEEYIFRNISNYGWIWCRGSILRSVDFCHKNSSTLLQVKNKYNTENSSSVTVRNNTTIKKWNRIGRPLMGQNRFNWEELNQIINQNKPLNLPNIQMTEENYQNFIKTSVANNPSLIYPTVYWDSF